MTEEEWDILMRRVLIEALKIEAEEEAKEIIPSFQPSRRHQQEIQAMLRNPLQWSKRKSRPLWKRGLQKAAVVLVALLLGLGTLFLVSPSALAAVTDKIITWYNTYIVYWYDTHILYRYREKPIPEKIPPYEITALPEGFSETERVELPLMGSITYKNSAGDAIYLNYLFMSESAATIFVTEQSTTINIQVNDMDGQFFQALDPGHFNTITWVDTSQNIQFNLSGLLDRDVILHIAESVSLVKTTK